MSPKSRGRPPGRGRSRRPASGRRPAGKPQRTGSISGWVAEEDTDCWFDEPLPGDRRSWAVPPGHGSYRGLDLERLDPHDEDERTFLLEAQHLDMAEALERHEEMTGGDGEPFNPQLHVTLHQVVANQILADDPPETWQTVQRLAGLGYDWHNVMHLIMGPVTEAVWNALAEKRSFDRADYLRQLAELPGDWPPPEELGRRLSTSGRSACCSGGFGGDLTVTVQRRCVGGGPAGIPAFGVAYAAGPVIRDAVAEHLLDRVVDGLVPGSEHRQQIPAWRLGRHLAFGLPRSPSQPLSDPDAVGHEERLA